MLGSLFLDRSNRFLVACSLAALTAVCGCNKGPAMYQVRGKVLYKDGSVPHAPVAVVNFTPTKDSDAAVRKPASGVIQADGSFTMFTRMNGDGVNAGDYAVLFNVAKEPMHPVSLLAPQYTNPASPPYKIKVDHDISDLEYTIEPLSGADAK